jgi:hypothetical protein
MAKVVLKHNVKLSEVLPNPKNPRVIRDHKFQQLVESIKTFPEMLSIREIVVDENMVILGGNMRFKACKEAGLKKLSVLVFSGLTQEQKDEFIIRDNANYGQWDWDKLANVFDEKELANWGMNVWQPDEHTAWDDDADCQDGDDLDTDGAPAQKENIKSEKKVIQLEFMIGDYDEAFGLVTFLRAKGEDISELLIKAMKQHGN